MTVKCDQTGHFFGYYPEHDVGFTCFECLEEFGPSGRRLAYPWNYSKGGMSRESRKWRSLHLPPPPPPDVPQEPVSETDDHGRQRSKPWRCLQQNCKFLACDHCADKLVDAEYVSSARDRDLSELQDKRNSIIGSEAAVQAGAATPPEQRTSRELRRATNKPLVAPEEPITVPEGGSLECDSDSDAQELGVDSLRTRLVYRRAGHVATSALAHYHHRDRPGRQFIPNCAPAKEVQEVKRATTVISEGFISTTGPGKQMVALEVDSKEASDDEDFMPNLTGRSATQAATQAMRSVHWRQRAGGMTTVPRAERA